MVLQTWLVMVKISLAWYECKWPNSGCKSWGWHWKHFVRNVSFCASCYHIYGSQ